MSIARERHLRFRGAPSLAIFAILLVALLSGCGDASDAGEVAFSAAQSSRSVEYACYEGCTQHLRLTKSNGAKVFDKPISRDDPIATTVPAGDYTVVSYTSGCNGRDCSDKSGYCTGAFHRGDGGNVSVLIVMRPGSCELGIS